MNDIIVQYRGSSGWHAHASMPREQKGEACSNIFTWEVGHVNGGNRPKK